MSWIKLKKLSPIALFLVSSWLLFSGFGTGYVPFDKTTTKPGDTIAQAKKAVRIMDVGFFEDNYVKPKDEFWVCYFWATWCLNCVRNHNILAQMDQQFRDQHVRMISLSLDAKKNKWLKFLDDHPADWEQVYLADFRFSRQFKKSFGDLSALPQMFLIDKTGKVRRIQFLNQLKSELQKAIEEG